MQSSKQREYPTLNQKIFYGYWAKNNLSLYIVLSCSIAFGGIYYHNAVCDCWSHRRLTLAKISSFKCHTLCEIPEEKKNCRLSASLPSYCLFPFLQHHVITECQKKNHQQTGVRTSAILQLQQYFLHTHFWHMWIKFYCSVNSFYCIHLCSTQPSP